MDKAKIIVLVAILCVFWGLSEAKATVIITESLQGPMMNCYIVSGNGSSETVCAQK